MAEKSLNPWRRVFLPFAAGYYLSYLLRNVNAVIAPDLTRDLAVSAADLGFLTSAYLFGFGAFQLPLGILLDRYGPRRVEAVLLTIAAAGCAAFAVGTNLAELALGRGLIGLGVSACLMASFKAFSLWFPAERQASLNAAVMAAGGLGALSATTPLAWALPLAGWRGIFAVLAVLALAAAAGIFSTPDRRAAVSRETLGEQLHALGGILRSRAYWRFAPQTATMSGGFMALQGLWAVPWLINVNGATREAAAVHMLLASGAMLAGFLALAAFVTRLARAGLPPQRILTAGIGVGIGVLALIVADVGATRLLWFAMGLVFSVTNLSYALLAANFPPHLQGRANTALNLAAFVGAFGLQWGIGVLVDVLGSFGLTPREAFRWAFAVLLLMQASAWGWFVLGARTRAGRRPGASADRVAP
ncbi:MAG: MFS transporter [Rhodocyclaceae bacterium]|nr:MFS transporter [Rhodocyclaceae bacterium]